MGYKNLMLVEGWNDQYVLRDLLRQHQIFCAIPKRDRIDKQDTLVIDQKGNFHRVLDSLDIILDDGDLEHLAVIVDANSNLSARWDSLKNKIINKGGENIPHMPLPGGTIITLNQPYRKLQVGVWLMPDNKTPGILEDFASFLIPEKTEPLWQHAKESVDNIPKGHQYFTNVAIPKAQIHTWLAWQEEPGTPLGQAITARFLNANAALALQLIDWVKNVFDFIPK